MMTVAAKQWVFTLSAIALIDDAHLGKTESILAYFFFVLAAQSLMLAPIISSAIAPRQSAKLVERTLNWMQRNSRGITTVVSLVFGVWLLIKAISVLTGHDSDYPH